MIFYIFNICNKSSFTCSHKEQQGKVLSGLHCREKKRKKKKNEWLQVQVRQCVCDLKWAGPVQKQVGGGWGRPENLKPSTLSFLPLIVRLNGGFVAVWRQTPMQQNLVQSGQMGVKGIQFEGLKQTLYRITNAPCIFLV